MVTLYNVVSKDWFIADKEGSEDFIPDKLWPTTLKVFKEFDALLMGRKTYESLQKYGKDLLEPFETLAIKKYVVSQNDELKVESEYVVVHSVEEIITSNLNVLVTSGPTLNNYLLDKKLVDKMVIHQISIVIGEGIPVFDQRYRPSLILQSEVELGLVKEIKYQVEK